MSVGVVIIDEGGGLKAINLAMLRLSSLRTGELLETVGSEVESQTRLRITETKQAPDGTEWADWSEGYAASKHGEGHNPHPGSLRSASGHDILQLSGELRDSIQSQVEGDEVVVGSNKVYSSVQQEEREFLGLSSQDGKDIEQLTLDFLADVLR